MKVEVAYRTDTQRPLTDPLPEANGVVFRLVKGDVCDPWLDPDGWFGPEKPLWLMRFWSPVPLPFFAWRVGSWPGYVGFKIYGVDSAAYRTMLPAEDVYEGSLAMHFSFRPFARRT